MKTKTRYFLLCIGAISISTIVGIAFLPPRWLYILYGVLAFVVGSVAQTKEWKTGKRVRPIFFITAIAVSGLLITKGWNEFSNHSNRQALISSAMREWEQNNKYLMDMDRCFEQLSNLDQVYLLPTFRYNAIQLIHTSPLFSKSSKRDSSLLDAAESFLYNVSPINDSVLKLNIIFSGTTSSLQHQKNTYISFYNSPLLERFRQNQKELHGELLKLKRGSNYKTSNHGNGDS